MTETTLTRSRWAVSVPAALMDDNNISIETRFFICLLLSMADNWKFRETDLRKRLGTSEKPMGRDRYQRIVREAKESGYLKIKTTHHPDGTISGRSWHIEPLPAQDDVHQQPENPATGDHQQPGKPADGSTGGRLTQPLKEYKDLKNKNNKLCSGENSPSTHTIEEHFEDFFFEAYPRPRDKDRSLELFREAVEAGANPQQIVQAAKTYAQEQKGNEIIFVSYSDQWLKRGRFKDYEPKSEPAPGDPVELWATSIKEKRYIDADRAQKHVEAMLARNLVTESEILQTGKLRLP